MTSLQEIVRCFFQAQANASNQGEVAKRIGMPRQNFGATLLQEDGRTFGVDHLAAYAAWRKVPSSVFLRELADFAWRLEGAVEGEGEMVDAQTARELGLVSTARRGRPPKQ